MGVFDKILKIFNSFWFIDVEEKEKLLDKELAKVVYAQFTPGFVRLTQGSNEENTRGFYKVPYEKKEEIKTLLNSEPTEESYNILKQYFQPYEDKKLDEDFFADVGVEHTASGNFTVYKQKHLFYEQRGAFNTSYYGPTFLYFSNYELVADNLTKEEADIKVKELIEEFKNKRQEVRKKRIVNIKYYP